MERLPHPGFLVYQTYAENLRMQNRNHRVRVHGACCLVLPASLKSLHALARPIRRLALPHDAPIVGFSSVLGCLQKTVPCTTEREIGGTRWDPAYALTPDGPGAFREDWNRIGAGFPAHGPGGPALRFPACRERGLARGRRGRHLRGSGRVRVFRALRDLPRAALRDPGPARARGSGRGGRRSSRSGDFRARTIAGSGPAPVAHGVAPAYQLP